MKDNKLPLISIITKVFLTVTDAGLGIAYLAMNRPIVGVLWLVQAPLWGIMAYWDYKNYKGE